jgi:hypothetical protein
MKPVKVIKKHLVEDRPLGRLRAIDSCHGRNKEQKIEPGS